MKLRRALRRFLYAIFPWLCDHYILRDGSRQQSEASRREREQFALRLAEIKLEALRRER